MIKLVRWGAYALGVGVLGILAGIGLTALLMPKPVNPPPLTVDQIVLLQRDFELGHACPVGGSLITANHMMDDLRDVGWTQGALRGQIGHGAWQRHPFLDAARTALPEGVKPILTGPNPEVGDEVYVVGVSQDGSFKQTWVRATVLSVYGYVMVLSNTPGPGSSGSCVLDTQGRAVGLNIGGREATWHNPARGIAIVGEGVLL